MSNKSIISLSAQSAAGSKGVIEGTVLSSGTGNFSEQTQFRRKNDIA